MHSVGRTLAKHTDIELCLAAGTFQELPPELEVDQSHFQVVVQAGLVPRPFHKCEDSQGSVLVIVTWGIAAVQFECSVSCERQSVLSNHIWKTYLETCLKRVGGLLKFVNHVEKIKLLILKTSVWPYLM